MLKLIIREQLPKKTGSPGRCKAGTPMPRPAVLRTHAEIPPVLGAP
jgi:hypothetical protein